VTDARRSLGIAGESAACLHLERQGYRILAAQRARSIASSVDIVAERGGA
jgi:Holliday junction resolvase-like predicted endonuclease